MFRNVTLVFLGRLRKLISMQFFLVTFNFNLLAITIQLPFVVLHVSM